MITWRLRFSLRATFKRVARYASRAGCGNSGHAGRVFTSDIYAMEEGYANGRVFASPRSSPRSSLSNSRSGPTFKPLQRFTLGLLPGSSSPSRPPRPLSLNTSVSRTSSWGMAQSPPKQSPNRSSSFPLPASLSSISLSSSTSVPNHNPPNPITGSSITLNASLSTGTAHQPTPPSPQLGGFDEAGVGVSLGSFYSTRSLNSSQMNLSSLVPRQATSRSNSVLHLPLDGD